MISSQRFKHSLPGRGYRGKAL